MNKRGIYFVHNGQLFVKSIDVEQSDNKDYTSMTMFNQAESFMQPCVDLSGRALTNGLRTLNIFNVKDANGVSIKQMWDTLDESKELPLLPPGSKELLYLSNMDELQIIRALSLKSVYDVYYSGKQTAGSPAIAVCALQMLYQQNKLDYLTDIDKFLYWFWCNCRFHIEWNDCYK